MYESPTDTRRFQICIATNVRLSQNRNVFSPIADSNSRHPLLELSLQRPVYRNYRLLMNGTLLVQKASEAEEGRYLCEADNGVNEPLGQVVKLKVNGKLMGAA